MLTNSEYTKSLTDTPLINICMSTYNGADFIDEQIQSILDQDYHNWQLLIHDDGSTDNTIFIIKKYQKKDPRIRFLNESSPRHLGVKRAFFSLAFSHSADFYMFSDQDDIWKSNKISVTLKEILKYDQSMPVLVHTDYVPFYGGLKQNLASYKSGYTQFKRILLANNVTGCTIIFNQTLRNIVKQSQIPYNKIIMHDWWLALIASGLGQVGYVAQPTMYYRQHANNVIGAPSHNFFKKLWSRLLGKSTFNIQAIVKQAQAMYVVWHGQMTTEDRKICQVIANLNKYWHPISQLVSVHHNNLRMNSKLKNIQFHIYIIVPNRLKKVFFGGR